MKNKVGKKTTNYYSSKNKNYWKALLNAIESQFEGYLVWEDISKNAYDSEISKKQNTENVRVVSRLKKKSITKKNV